MNLRSNYLSDLYRVYSNMCCGGHYEFLIRARARSASARSETEISELQLSEKG